VPAAPGHVLSPGHPGRADPVSFRWATWCALGSRTHPESGPPPSRAPRGAGAAHAKAGLVDPNPTRTSSVARANPSWQGGGVEFFFPPCSAPARRRGALLVRPRSPFRSGALLAAATPGSGWAGDWPDCRGEGWGAEPACGRMSPERPPGGRWWESHPSHPPSEVSFHPRSGPGAGVGRAPGPNQFEATSQNASDFRELRSQDVPFGAAPVWLTLHRLQLVSERKRDAKVRSSAVDGSVSRLVRGSCSRPARIRTESNTAGVRVPENLVLLELEPHR
jgi:hypothetical protein